MCYKRLAGKSLVHVLALGVAILIAYYGLWNAYFAGLDDFGIIGWARNHSLIDTLFKGYGISSLQLVSLGFTWVLTRLFDLKSAPYFWVSLVQHAIVTYMIYRLVKFWTKRPTTGLLAALIFAVKFSTFEVVTSAAASTYSFRAIIYLLTLALFAIYLENRKLSFYLGSLGMYLILVFTSDFALSIPLILIAYHLTLGRGPRKIRSLGWGDLRLHLSYWFIWGVHVALQFIFVFSGSWQSLYVSEEAYEPGLHMIGNLAYLVFLLVPNVHFDSIYNFLTAYISAGLVETFWHVSIGLAIVGNILAGILLWKGSNLVRFALAMIYVPFLQYTLWRGGFVGASRYLYLPSVGFSILVAFLLIWLYDYLAQKEGLGYRFVVPGVVAILLVFNLVVIQVWVQRHIENGRFRRPFVTQLATAFQDVELGSRIYIEVPTDKYTDL
jgi:hypothetical protein